MAAYLLCVKCVPWCYMIGGYVWCKKLHFIINDKIIWKGSLKYISLLRLFVIKRYISFLFCRLLASWHLQYHNFPAFLSLINNHSVLFARITNINQNNMYFKDGAIALILLLFTTLSIYAQDKPEVSLGGALRFNYNYSDWIQESKNTAGQFGFDVFRLNANGGYKNIIFDAEYRFYSKSSGGSMLKHGWVGYQFDDKHQLQLGLNTIPFGLMPYNSNSYFFSINYYLGMEDDADMGIKYSYADDKWSLAAAFYKNSDILSFHSSEGLSSSRYSYDIVGRNKEMNQGNMRIARRWRNEYLNAELGASAQVGGIYNIDTEKMGARTAFAFHYLMDIGRWNLKAQFTTYNMLPKNEDEQKDIIEMGAYGSPYNIVAKGDTYTVGIAYSIPINKGILDEIKIYNDFGMMDKRVAETTNSYQNVTGAMLTMGPIYTYLDYAMGRNHAWLGDEWTEAFAKEANSKSWSARLNLNLGYYF